MGSSGAGKTTLLDVLAGRKTGGTITGDIRLNGHPKIQKTFTRRARKAHAGWLCICTVCGGWGNINIVSATVLLPSVDIWVLLHDLFEADNLMNEIAVTCTKHDQCFRRICCVSQK